MKIISDYNFEQQKQVMNEYAGMLLYVQNRNFWLNYCISELNKRIFALIWCKYKIAHKDAIALNLINVDTKAIRIGNKTLSLKNEKLTPSQIDEFIQKSVDEVFENALVFNKKMFFIKDEKTRYYVSEFEKNLFSFEHKLTWDSKKHFHAKYELKSDNVYYFANVIVKHDDNKPLFSNEPNVQLLKDEILFNVELSSAMKLCILNMIRSKLSVLAFKKKNKNLQYFKPHRN